MKNFPQKGFTVIELMIVMVIIAILASVAFSNYSESSKTAKRTDARSTLLDTAVKLEKCQAVYAVYNHASCTINNNDEIISPDDGLYSIKVTSTAIGFSLTATPVAGKSQASDATCASFTLTNTGVQTATGTDSGSCW